MENVGMGSIWSGLHGYLWNSEGANKEMLMHLTSFELNTKHKTKLKAHLLSGIHTFSYSKADGLIHILNLAKSAWLENQSDICLQALSHNLKNLL